MQKKNKLFGRKQAEISDCADIKIIQDKERLHNEGV
jgi:hypothetical protein